MNDVEHIKILKKQISRLANFEFYKKRFRSIGLRPEDINTFEDFEKIPFMDPNDIQGDLEEHPPHGTLFHRETVRTNLSIGPKGLMPAYHTRSDIEEVNKEQAAMFQHCGVRVDDVAAITFGYHLFHAGLTLQGGFEALGCKTIPLGPGETQRAVEILNRFQVTVLASNPSFAIKLAQEGVKSVRILLAGGEPFSSVEGYKDKLRKAFGQITLIDSYGSGHSAPIARECQAESGLHVADNLLYLEIVDPETGRNLPDGERGEVVITHLRRQASPLLRFRTGDLSVLEHINCPCGRKATLTKGVLGRTDEMYKVKGVKLYPSQIDHILRSLPDYSPGKYQVTLNNKRGGGDSFCLFIEGKDPGSDEKGQITERMKQILLIKPDRIDFGESLPIGGKVIDKR